MMLLASLAASYRRRIPIPVNTYFYDFEQATTGELPSSVELRRSSVPGDYRVDSQDGRNVLTYSPSSGGTVDRGIKLTDVPEGSSTIYVRAVVRDLNASSPPSARIIANATDDPANEEYGVLISGSLFEVRLYKRVNGSYSALATTSLPPSFSAANYYVVELKVEHGAGASGACLVSGRAYQEGSAPSEWITASDNALAQGGYVGAAGAAQDANIHYESISVGLDGAEPPVSSVSLTSPADGESFAVGSSVPLSVTVETFDANSVDYIIERVS